jgi:hypothetical protein
LSCLGSVINTYQVEDKVQRVADHGVEISQELLNEQPDLIDLSNETIVLVDLTERRQRAWANAWANAWAHLDADLQQHGFSEEENADAEHYEQRQWQQLMERRRAAAAVQTGTGRNAFDEQPAAWETPTTRPRTTFPHLPHEMSKEESDSWKMMELAEKIEKSRKKRCGSTSSDECLLERLGIDVAQGPSDGRKFKRPRTKRDSQLSPISTRNIHNSESFRSGEAILVSTPTGNASDAGSPPPGGIFTSILEGIGRTQDIPIVSAADVSGRDLTKMRPISPDRSSIASAISRSCSPTTFSPSSPSSLPESQPTSPISSERSRGRRKLYSPSTSARTPAHSPEKSGRRPWETGQPSSPPPSRAQSPNGRPNDIMRRESIASSVGSPPGSSDELSKQQQERYSKGITKQNKSEIGMMVSTALKPYYPEKLSRESYKEVNKKISRRMYRLACDQGFLDTNKELWTQTIKDEVDREMNCL